MSLSSCERRCECTGIAVVVSVILGIITAFLRITAVISLTPAFLWVTLGVAVVYLAVVLFSVAVSDRCGSCADLCCNLTALLVGIVGTVLLSVVLLAIEFVATSVIGAILTGALLLFFFLIITTTACLVRCVAGCKD